MSQLGNVTLNCDIPKKKTRVVIGSAGVIVLPLLAPVSYAEFVHRPMS